MFGYEFSDDPVSVCKIIRNLKDRFYGDPLEDTDEDILEKIIFTIDLGHWCSDFFSDNSEKESEGSWLSSLLEDLTEDEYSQRGTLQCMLGMLFVGLIMSSRYGAKVRAFKQRIFMKNNM